MSFSLAAPHPSLSSFSSLLLFFFFFVYLSTKGGSQEQGRDFVYPYVGFWTIFVRFCLDLWQFLYILDFFGLDLLSLVDFWAD